MDDEKLTQIEQLRLHVACELSPPCLDSLQDEVEALEAENACLRAKVAKADALWDGVTDWACDPNADTAKAMLDRASAYRDDPEGEM